MFQVVFHETSCHGYLEKLHECFVPIRKCCYSLSSQPWNQCSPFRILLVLDINKPAAPDNSAFSQPRSSCFVFKSLIFSASLCWSDFSSQLKHSNSSQLSSIFKSLILTAHLSLLVRLRLVTRASYFVSSACRSDRIPFVYKHKLISRIQPPILQVPCGHSPILKSTLSCLIKGLLVAVQHTMLPRHPMMWLLNRSLKNSLHSLPPTQR